MNFVQVMRNWVLISCLLLCLPVVSWSQTDQGRVSGTVRDESDKVIAGATIVVKNERTGEERTVITSEKGTYLVPALKPSSYLIKVTSPDFTPAQFTNVELVVGQELILDATLKPSGASEVVTVMGSDEASIDTTSARIGANVNQRELQALPLNGRQLSQLYLQAPGAVNTGNGSFGDIRFSGRSNEQNAIRYDGIEGSAIIDANPGNLNGELASPFRLQSSLENVQEFRVESSSYPAEYGTGTGGQISVVSKSGSNDFHGSVFEYLRNSALDARNQFDRDKSPLRLNQFGGSIGGPIVKDKAFFFFSFEGYRLRSGVNFVEAVPSAAAIARAVPAVKPLAAAFLGPGAVILPGASTNPDFAIAQLASNVRVNENAVGLRLDYKFNSNNSIYARYYRDQGTDLEPQGVTGRQFAVRSVPQNGVLAFQSILNPTLINEFKFGFNAALSRVSGMAPVVNGIDLSQIVINTSGSVASSGIAGQGATSGLAVPGGLIRGSSAFNGRGFPYTPYSLSYVDTLSWIRGTHSIKFGVEIRQIRLYTDRLGGTTYSYANLNDFLANKAANIQYVSDLSDPSPFNGGATGNRLAKQEYYIGYAQDEWKIRPNFTLNYGLRYEYYSPLREDRDLAVLFDITAGKLLSPKQEYYFSKKTNFQPRVGIAWSPKPGSSTYFGGGKTVIRAGFGMFNGPGQTEDQIQPIESDRIATTISGGMFPLNIPAVRANFINNPNNRQFQPRAYSPDYAVPERTYNYTVSIQQELPYKMVLTAAYIGSLGRNLFLRNWANRIVDVKTNPATGAGIVIREFDIVNGDPTKGGTIQRPFAEIDFKTSGGHDRYDALQLSLARRFISGLTLNSQYTFGRSYGNTAGSNDALTTGNPFDYNYDEGYNNFDVRHAFNLSAVYDLPFGKGKKFLNNMNGIGQTLVGGWEIGGIVNARSGLPIDVRLTRPDVLFVDKNGNVFSSPAPDRTAVINTLGGGSSRNVRRPDLIPGVNPFLDSGRNFLNPAAFAVPKPGTFGTLRRNELHGPNFRQFDLMLNKRFALTERARLEFRAEFYNLFNFTNYSNPVATLSPTLGTAAGQIQPGQAFSAATTGNANFGKFTSTVERTVGIGTNRQIQFALRLSF